MYVCIWHRQGRSTYSDMLTTAAVIPVIIVTYKPLQDDWGDGEWGRGWERAADRQTDRQTEVTGIQQAYVGSTKS